MNQELHLSKDFTISISDYASQGNAVLGIRDAGKTYTAMKAAESLMDAGVPIIVYDPVGVWKNLKIGAGKNKGYQVVIAGGAGSDIILTTSNAIDIVRAAMKENVNLVIDLYSPELINKSSWISIVQQTVDVLMYENKSYGLRHIFLEEAAEFIPQRLQPQHARVYASIERLARMGRNARLGYTIINQRAEEVKQGNSRDIEFQFVA
jgi:DNA helicase HerA-like ATPase